MKNNLLITTALVAASFAASNAWAEYVQYTDKNPIPHEDVTGHNNTDNGAKDRISIAGDAGMVEDEATLEGVVTLQSNASINKGKDPKKLTVRGYFTVDQDADISGVDLYMEKGLLTGEKSGGDRMEGELVLAKGKTLTVGNVHMTDGTNIYLDGANEENGAYHLKMGEGKALTLEGNNQVYGGDGKSEHTVEDNTVLYFETTGEATSENKGAVVNEGTLTATGIKLEADTTVTNNGTITAKEIGIGANHSLTNNGEITVKDGDKNGQITGKGTLAMGANAHVTGDVEMTEGTLAFDGDHVLSETFTGDVSVKDINVKNGSLNLDKEATVSGTITVGTEDSVADLNIGTNTVQNVTLNDGSSMSIEVKNGKEGIDNGKVSGTLTANGDNNLSLFIDDDVELEDALDLGTGVETALKDKKLNLSEDNLVYNMEIDEDTGEVTATKNSASEIAANVAKKIGSTSLAGVAGAYAGATGLEEGSIAAAIHEQMNLAAQTGDVATIENLSEDIAPVLAPVVQTVETNQLAHAYGAVSSQLSANSIDTASAGVSSGDGVFDKAVIWVKGLFNKSTVDDMSDAKGFDVETKGVAFGAHNEVADNVKVGVAYAYGDTEIDGHHRDIDVDSHTFMLYGEYKPSNWYVNGIASYGFSKYKEHKNSMVGRINGKYDVNVFGLQAMTGYEALAGSVNVTPEIGLRYARLDQEAYTDSADQRIRAEDQDILTAIADVKASKEFALDNGISLRPEARLGVTYDLMDGDNSAVVNSPAGTYRLEGESLERFGVEAGLGLTASLGESWDVSAGYEGRFRKDYEDHAGILSAKYKF